MARTWIAVFHVPAMVGVPVRTPPVDRDSPGGRADPGCDAATAGAENGRTKACCYLEDGCPAAMLNVWSHGAMTGMRATRLAINVVAVASACDFT